jgi:phosphoribosylamine--glycine ligase
MPNGHTKKRVLFVSGELIAGALALSLKREGCEVKLYIENPKQQECLNGFVKKTKNWKKELSWVGKDGLIIFDDVGYGKIQDQLRKKGYKVFGGSAIGDKLELDRDFGQKILAKIGMQKVPTYNFSTCEKAIKFIKLHPLAWVLKQNAHQSALTYVGVMQNGKDVIGLLENYLKKDVKNISLQKKISGIELSINRYFNGHDWVGPSELTIEHKSLFNDNIGPKTGEMGNLMWYDDKEGKFFQETLARLKPFLKKIDFRGNIDINCLVKESRVFPIEITSRFGCPITYSQDVMHLFPWYDFLSAIAEGRDYEFKHRNGYCIALTLGLPPFPYEGNISSEYLSNGLEIFFDGKLSAEEKRNLHFESVVKKDVLGKSRIFVSKSIGYLMFLTGYGKDVSAAQKKVYSLAKKIIIPRFFYRTDIGKSFINTDRRMLKKWGWI